MGTTLDDPARFGRALADTLAAMQSMPLRSGMKVPIATSHIEYPADGFLDRNVRDNERKLHAVQTAALVASGGTCAPPQPSYVQDSVSVEDRPVRAGLPNWGLDRGGAVIPAPMLLDDLDGAATVWTHAMDVAAVSDPEVRKDCLRLTCGDDDTIIPDAIVQCLEVGNWDARTWPERVARFQQLADAWTARKAERQLLTTMGSLSTQVTVAQNLGTARDVLSNLDLAGAALRNRHRMGRNVFLRWMAPGWLMDQMRSDLTREMPGSADERLAAADAYIESFFMARRINVTWTLDGETGQDFGAQTDGTLLGWIPNVVSYLFPEGHFQYGNGGDMNLGLVRDSDLNSRNDFQFFKEFWETVFVTGPESYRLTMTLCPTGASAGTVEPVCTDVASS